MVRVGVKQRWGNWDQVIMTVRERVAGGSGLSDVLSRLWTGMG